MVNGPCVTRSKICNGNKTRSLSIVQSQNVAASVLVTSYKTRLIECLLGPARNWHVEDWNVTHRPRPPILGVGLDSELLFGRGQRCLQLTLVCVFFFLVVGCRSLWPNQHQRLLLHRNRVSLSRRVLDKLGLRVVFLNPPFAFPLRSQWFPRLLLAPGDPVLQGKELVDLKLHQNARRKSMDAGIPVLQI